MLRKCRILKLMNVYTLLYLDQFLLTASRAYDREHAWYLSHAMGGFSRIQCQPDATRCSARIRQIMLKQPQSVALDCLQAYASEHDIDQMLWVALQEFEVNQSLIAVL